jgi:hypothetical protein
MSDAVLLRYGLQYSYEALDMTERSSLEGYNRNREGGIFTKIQGLERNCPGPVWLCRRLQNCFQFTSAS